MFSCKIFHLPNLSRTFTPGGSKVWYKSYLPGTGDTLINKGVLPGRGLSIALRWADPCDRLQCRWLGGVISWWGGLRSRCPLHNQLGRAMRLFVHFITDLAVRQLNTHTHTHIYIYIFQSEKQCLCLLFCHYMLYILWLKGRVTLVAFTRTEKRKKKEKKAIRFTLPFDRFSFLFLYVMLTFPKTLIYPYNLFYCWHVYLRMSVRLYKYPHI